MKQFILSLAAVLCAVSIQAQTYKVNDMVLNITSITAGAASNSTAIANSGGYAPSMIKLANPFQPFDVTVNFTCNTQVFWGAVFLFGGCTDGVTPNTFGGSNGSVDQNYGQLFRLSCPTNTVGVSNYAAIFRSTDTNLFCKTINWGNWVVFHGATNIAPTTLTINKISVGQVQ